VKLSVLKILLSTAAKQGEARRTEIAREQQAGVTKDYYASPEGQAEIQRTQAEFVQRITDLRSRTKNKKIYLKKINEPLANRLKSLSSSKKNLINVLVQLPQKYPAHIKRLNSALKN